MRYPIPGVASLASSALHPPADVPDTLGTVITSQEKQHLRWMHKAAASAVLMLPGQAAAAVADIHHLAAATNGQDSVVLTLDIVHQPFTFSEFVEHGLQYYDERSHYHFHAPAGVELDAAKFLDKVEEAQGAPTGEFESGWHVTLAMHPLIDLQVEGVPLGVCNPADICVDCCVVLHQACLCSSRDSRRTSGSGTLHPTSSSSRRYSPCATGTGAAIATRSVHVQRVSVDCRVCALHATVQASVEDIQSIVPYNTSASCAAVVPQCWHR